MSTHVNKSFVLQTLEEKVQGLLSVGYRRVYSYAAIIAALFLFGLPIDVAAATVVVTKEDKCNIVITLSGAIDSHTDTDLVAAYNSLNKDNLKNCKYPTINLSSNGGDVEAAMRAGDFVRQNKMSTLVDNSCASACVLLFLGGVNRTLWGWSARIGLHRPYSESYSTSESAAKDTYERINRQIRQYLNRMNVPEGLLDIMNSVPPTEIKWLTDKEDSNRLKELFIAGSDPVWPDQEDSLEAKRRGISKQVLYSRRNKIHSVCGGMFDDIFEGRTDSAYVDRWGKCSEDVMNGKR